MATPGEKLAESLEKLKVLQDSGVVGIKANDFTRVHRERYMESLEAASVDQDIKPFAKFLGWLVEEGMKGTPVAKV